MRTVSRTEIESLAVFRQRPFITMLFEKVWTEGCVEEAQMWGTSEDEPSWVRWGL